MLCNSCRALKLRFFKTIYCSAKHWTTKLKENQIGWKVRVFWTVFSVFLKLTETSRISLNGSKSFLNFCWLVLWELICEFGSSLILVGGMIDQLKGFSKILRRAQDLRPEEPTPTTKHPLYWMFFFHFLRFCRKYLRLFSMMFALWTQGANYVNLSKHFPGTSNWGHFWADEGS